MNVFTRYQKPTIRDFLLVQAYTRNHLCTDEEIFDPCAELSSLSEFEKATLTSWSSDSNVDKGLNLYILLHFLSGINGNSYYYHYINNGSSDGTNMFGHVIGTSGSGKSTALTPHMDALARTLFQMDTKQEYIQTPNKTNDLTFEQPFIISNATTLHVYKSLTYGNRLLCSTECDSLLSNLGVYGNLYNDPRYLENVNMLIQMFDGTKHQNRSTLSTSYSIPEGRRATIIGASVGDPYARVSQQHYEGNGISGAHNRFTHYPCPVTKAVKPNSGFAGVVSNMVPSLQHIYTVSFLLGKVEYVPRQNVYDQPQKKHIEDKTSPDVEEKWKRLKPTAVRHFSHSTAKSGIELQEVEVDSTPDESKSAFYYMFDRVYKQWQDATIKEQQEHEAIINFKNSTKIPRFICNFARFRTIMNILWDDSVYPLIDISEVIKPPYAVSYAFIDAVQNAIDKLFPSNLRKSDGAKIVIIEKETAIMGDLFFGHVDNVSRQLFDLSPIQEKFSSSPTTQRSGKKNYDSMEMKERENLVYDDAAFIIRSKFIFFSTSTFTHHQKFRNLRHRLHAAIQYLIDNSLLYESSEKNRFIKGSHKSYALAGPIQIRKNKLAMEALGKLNLNIDDYEQIWHQCIFPEPTMATKIEKAAINHIWMYLDDYIMIIHRLGSSTDPVAQAVLKPNLKEGRIGVDLQCKLFSLACQHIYRFKSDNDITQLLVEWCYRASDQTSNSTKLDTSPEVDRNFHSWVDTSLTHTKSLITTTMTDNHSEHDEIVVIDPNSLSNEKNVDDPDESSNIDASTCDDCEYILEMMKTYLDNMNTDHDDKQPSLPSFGETEDFCQNGFSLNNLEQLPFRDDSPCDKTFSDVNTNEEISDADDSIEYTDPSNDLIIINRSDYTTSSRSAQNGSSTVTSTSSEFANTPETNVFTDNSIETELCSAEKAPVEQHIGSGFIHNSDIKNTKSSTKDFDIIALSKRIMLKPYVTFTKTDATRLYNDAEKKNVVIAYLMEHEFIIEISDLFISTNPTKEILKSEIGYLKLFPKSSSAIETTLFEAKLREKIGITFDDYFNNILVVETPSESISTANNMFNPMHHKWLLNRSWYEKLNAGYHSSYFENNLKCPNSKMTVVIVPLATVSNDHVQDPFDVRKSKMTASQRTDKELKRLGTKRQIEPGDLPSTKRIRKPKRFTDED